MTRKKRVRLSLQGCKHFQWQTLVFFISYSLVSSLALLLTVMFVIIKYYPSLVYILRTVIVYSSFTILICLVFSIVMLLVYTNKISGPIQRLQRYLVEILEGDLSAPIKFRSDDEFKELAEAINRFRESIIKIKSLKK